LDKATDANAVVVDDKHRVQPKQTVVPLTALTANAIANISKVLALPSILTT